MPFPASSIAKIGGNLRRGYTR